MNINIVDTTLRDGEQSAGIALRANEKVQIAKLLDKLGIYQIEAGIPIMGGDEKKSIQKIIEQNLKSKISVWNRMNAADIRQSMECGNAIIHISVPSSDIQITSKLNKDRLWVIENLKKCIYLAKEKGYEVTIGLEDASRADFKFLLQIIATCFLEGVQRVRYADTVGVLHRQRIFDEISRIKAQLNIGLEMHAHNDLGMAVANSVSAVKAGAQFVDCTVGGIGERAGNCDYLQFVSSAKACLGIFKSVDIKGHEEVQKEILRLIKGK